MKLIKLETNKNISLDKKVYEYLNPDFIYLPMLNKNQKRKYVKKGEYILGSMSSISGNLKGAEKCLNEENKNVPCVIIKNDFLEDCEKIPSRKKINNLTKEEIINSLLNINLKNKLNINSVKTIVISGIDIEPFIGLEAHVQKIHLKNILETIDLLLKVYHAEKAILVISNLSSEIIDYYNDYLGTYHSIFLKMVPDYYFALLEKYLIKYLHIKSDYLFLKTTEVYDLYYQIKNKKIATETYITIGGNFSKEIKVFLVKIGTKVIDIIKKFYDININDYDIYVNGVLSGKKVILDNLIVTQNLTGLVIMNKTNVKVYECIKCGKCNDICPINSKPIMAYKGRKKINCINCGLCSFVCPSNIPLRKYIGEENE